MWSTALISSAAEGELAAGVRFWVIRVPAQRDAVHVLHVAYIGACKAGLSLYHKLWQQDVSQALQQSVAVDASDRLPSCWGMLQSQHLQ